MEEERKSTKVLQLLALAVPLILGVCGFLQAGEGVLQALFLSISLYTLEYQDLPANFLVELARWTAPLATASGVFLAFSTVRRRLHNLLRYRRGNSVAVYGPDARRAPLLAELGRRGIDGGEDLAGRFVRAQRYILLGEEQENFSFYTGHAPRLTGSEVWLQCSSLPAQSTAPAGLHLFCPEETAARLYWKEQSLYPLWRARGPKLRVAFVGFGRLGEELLSAGLQNNVFSPEQCIEYHIFGEDNGFAAVHTELGEIGDPVLFRPEPWQQSLPLLEQADLVLVLEQENQPALVGALLLALRNQTRQLVVFAADPALLGLLDGQQRLSLFDWRRKAQGLDAILGDELLLRAKRINLRYAYLYKEVTEENDKNMEERWQALDAFTRYSNISAADYHDVRLAMLAERGETPNALSARSLEELAVLEHIRWCRYHWLNNWRYGRPANGKAKDAVNRIHADLVPYEQLPEDEKDKDRSNIRLLCELG